MRIMSSVRNLIRSAVHRIVGRDPNIQLNPDKKELIDFACERLHMASFADLGAVWNVEGGYTFYAMERHHVQSAVLVDSEITQPVFVKQHKWPRLQIIQGNFGEDAIARRVGQVDGVFFFDTLLHQVKPDWNEVLELYAANCKHMLVFNRQLTNSSKTVRLLDLGIEEYFRHVPHRADEEPYKTYIRDLDIIHPVYNKPYRDAPDIWQWGIVDADLIRVLHSLGFQMQFYKNCGRCANLKNIEDHAFVFSKST